MLVARRVSLSLVVVLGFFGSACGEPSPTLAEALAAGEAEKLPPDFKPSPKPRPKGLDGPTDAEFKAWNRKDPEGEKHLYKWDKANLGLLLGYWEDLQCFREKVMEEGQKAFGAEPGTPIDEQWFQFKSMFINHINGWQQRMFADVPKIDQKSKFIGDFLAAHELAMNAYPKAYNESDKVGLEKADLQWMRIEQKLKKYTNQLGGEWPELDPKNSKAMEKHAKHCTAAMTPPDRSGKAKKRRPRR